LTENSFSPLKIRNKIKLIFFQEKNKFLILFSQYLFYYALQVGGADAWLKSFSFPLGI
jgi:hypothetical protein